MSPFGMTSPRRANPAAEEIQLLDAEIFETPRRLSRADALDQTGGLHDRHPFDQPDPEDDR
jgi:hypothetical protein